MYLWENPRWPAFSWEASKLLDPLATARHKQGRLLGRMLQLGFGLQLEAHVQGKLTARKWAALAKCSVGTAQRDIHDLLARGLLVKNQGGSKNTSDSIA